MTIKTRNITDAAITAAKIAANTITAAKLSATMATGFIDLPLTSWRVSNAANTNYGLVAATALIGSGGVGGIDGEPSLIRVNAGTDKTAKLSWIDAKLDPVFNDFVLPPDIDASAVLTFKMLVAPTGAGVSDVFTLTWWAVAAGAYAADTEQGGNTSAIAQGSGVLAVKSIVIPARALNAAGTHVSVGLFPTSPGTNVEDVYGTWVEYTRV